MGGTVGTRRVCFVAGTLGVGGAERQLLYMCRVLSAGGHRPEVVALEGGVFAERIEAIGVPVHLLPPVRNPVERAVQITREVRRLRPNLIQASHNWVSAYAAIAGRVLRRPAIGALRSAPGETFHEIGRLGHLALRLPSLIAANSMASIDDAVGFGLRRDRLVHLPNAIDTDRFQPEPALEGDHRPTLLAVGRLAERKRFDRVLDVVAELRTATPNLRAIIVGDGPERDRLQAQADRLGLDDEVSWITTDDPLPQFQQADVFLFSSGALEGMPNVVLEAMACGLPVVALESGDVASAVIDGVTGRLVQPSGDTSAFAAAVGQLVDDADQRRELGTRAREHMVASYSMEALSSNLDRLHELAIRGR